MSRERAAGTHHEGELPTMQPWTEMELVPAARFPDRLDALSREGRPAVVTGLLDGQPSSALLSREKVRELLGSAPMTMGRNYLDFRRHEILDFLSGRKRPLESEETTLAAYLDLAERAPEARRFYAEGPVPVSFLALMDLRSIGLTRLIGGYVERTEPRRRDTAYTQIFAGNAGNAADLHTDWDGHDVLLYQGFGHKHVTLFPPAAAPHFHSIGWFSTVRLSDMPQPARRDFVRYAGGVEHMLQPGEAVFMPAFCWHHLEYVDLAISIAIRFYGIQDADVLFPIDRMHKDLYLQNLMAASLDPAKAAAVRAAMLEIRAAFERSYPSARVKYRAMRALAREKCLALGLFDGAFARETWLEFEDLLDGIECTPYQELIGGSPLRRWWWHTRERARSLVRRSANRVANWA